MLSDISDDALAVLQEFFPDGLPPSATAQAIESGQARVINTSRRTTPLLDLTELWSEDGDDSEDAL
jgi:hypothetical protein